MIKTYKSEKHLEWTKQDKIKNGIVYAVNALIILAVFFLSIYVGGFSGGVKLENFIKDAQLTISVVVFVALVVSSMAIYFFFEEKDFMKNALNSQMIFFIIEISLIGCFAIGKYINIYLRPVVLPALIVMFLCNRKSAVFVNFTFSIMLFVFDLYIADLTKLTNFSSLFIGITSGMVAIFFTSKIYSRIKLIIASLIISVPAFICALLLLCADGWTNVLISILCSVLSGSVSVMLFLIILPIVEVIFRRISCFNLAELTDHKSKLIKRLIAEAPGTFNHSIVVSNIAEACATAIGEDALLARTCAYYHDIGKLRRPEFFGENDAENNSPHDELTPELSANIIKAHAQDGYNLVLKNRLPKEIADVCLEHHGTMPILFFYHKAKKLTDGEVDISQFCYNGPKPQTKIAAIIMIADGCEAISRTLKDRSREKVSDVVKKIVNERMELGQFDECEITIKELDIIIHTIVNNLTGIYHNRIKYPKVNLNGIQEEMNKEEE